MASSGEKMATDKWTGLRKHALSAQNFKDPLLLALGQATGFKAKIPVDYKTVYTPVCEKVGVTIDQFGKPKSSTQTWVERWIQEAFKTLIRFELAERTGRGRWALTESGVARAKTLTPHQDTEEVEVEEVEDATGEMGYHKDPYIRSLAAQKTGCFGMHSASSSTCIDCPLQFQCINALAAEMSRLNQEMIGEQKAPKVPKVKETPKVDTPSAPQAKAQIQYDGREVKVQVACTCKRCGGALAQGDDAVWVKSSTANASAAGMYHPDCFKEL